MLKCTVTLMPGARKPGGRTGGAHLPSLGSTSQAALVHTPLHYRAALECSIPASLFAHVSFHQENSNSLLVSEERRRRRRGSSAGNKPANGGCESRVEGRRVGESVGHERQAAGRACGQRAHERQGQSRIGFSGFEFGITAANWAAKGHAASIHEQCLKLCHPHNSK